MRLGNSWASEVSPACLIQVPTASRVGSVISNCTGRWGLLLQHDRPRCHAAPVANVSDPQLDEVAGSKLAVDGEVEQRQLAATVGELQADSNRPDLFEFQQCFLTDEPSLVPGFANGSRAMFHGWLDR